MANQSKMLRPSGSHSNGTQSTRGRSTTTRTAAEKENDPTVTSTRGNTRTSTFLTCTLFALANSSFLSYQSSEDFGEPCA